MNSETNLPDPQLKFTTGVQKGKPLDSAGMSYRIIERAGEQIALFRNGAMARFYRDTAIETAEPTNIATVALDQGENVPEKIEGPILCSPRPRMIITAYRHRDGSRPLRFWDQVYCVLEDGHPRYTIGRAETGTGLREYLWLYQKLREFGRAKLAALWEAWKIYFL